jgi:hypothetical protein
MDLFASTGGGEGEAGRRGGFASSRFRPIRMKSKLAIKICRLRAFFLFCCHARPLGSMSHEKRFMLAQTVAKYTGAPVDVVLEGGRKAGG